MTVARVADDRAACEPIARPSAVSSADGQLKHLLFSCPKRALRQPGFRAVYADLFASLPETARLTLLVHPGVRRELDELLAATRPAAETTIVSAPEELAVSVWAEDPFVAVRDRSAADDAVCLIQPASFDREDDDSIAGVLAAATDIEARRSALHFHGASILVGDDFILVGRDCLDTTLRGVAVPASTDAIDIGASLFERALDPERRVVCVGTQLAVPGELRARIDVAGRELLEVLHEANGSAQPLAHLDMFITLAGRSSAGRYRLLVGSPALADHVLGRAPLERAMPELFDDVAEGLARQGFDVIRNPLPLTYADGLRSVDGVPREVRRWYFASSNNCLVQVDETHGNQVWLPTYGHGAWRELAATDEANRRIWEELGFTVHELTSAHGLAQSHGSLHCVAKCLERGAAPRPPSRSRTGRPAG